MKDGICPKCGSKEVLAQPRGGLHGRLSRSTTYICGECGYVETYVDGAYLAKLKAKWSKATHPLGE